MVLILVFCYFWLLLILLLSGLGSESWHYSTNCDFTKKAVRIINFRLKNSHTSPLFKQNFILKFQDKICLENILFVSKSLNNLRPSIFSTWFSFSSEQHNYETSSSAQGNLTKLFCKTNRYGKYSITVSTVESSSKVQKQLKDRLLKDLSLREIKAIISNFYLKSYQ